MPPSRSQTADAPPPSAPPPASALAVQTPQNSALATRGTAQGGRGKENLDTHDLLIPRLDIVQRTSGSIDPTSEKYIPGAQFTNMVNSLTKDNYGNGPITILCLSLPRKRGVQFSDDNKTILDRNVPLDYDEKTGEFKDARLNFTGPKEARVKPVAQLMYEFPVLILSDGSYQLAMITLKSTQIRTAQELISIINYRKGDVFDGRYTVTTVRKDFPKGPSGLFVIRPAGAASDADAAAAEEYYQMLQTRTVTVDDSGLENDADDSKTPF